MPTMMSSYLDGFRARSVALKTRRDTKVMRYRAGIFISGISIRSISNTRIKFDSINSIVSLYLIPSTKQNILDAAVVGSERRGFGTARWRQGCRHETTCKEIVLEHLVKSGPVCWIGCQQLSDQRSCWTRNPLRDYVHIMCNSRVSLSQCRRLEWRLTHQHGIPRTIKGAVSKRVQ